MNEIAEAITRPATINQPLPQPELTEARELLPSSGHAPRSIEKRARPQPQAITAVPTNEILPAAEIQGADCDSAPKAGVPPETALGGLLRFDDHTGRAAQADEGRPCIDNQPAHALVGEINVMKRRYDDLRRARQRLELQAMSTCRSYLSGDKEQGAKLYRSPTAEIQAWLAPYMEAMGPLDLAIKAQEKLLTKLGKQLPVIEWANGIAGLSPRFLALIVGECGIGPGEYRTVSALWKRMGLAVIGGERQRRVTGDAAIEHGYVARRRSLMWNIGESIIKQQVRKCDDDVRMAIGDYGRIYLERKVYEATKTDRPIIAHNRAKRYMEKRLLRELWRAWRRASCATQTKQTPPAAEVEP